jgi:hypothetical protein
VTATTPSTTILRHDLALLRARYDTGATQPGVYAVIRALEVEIAWIEHGERFGVPIAAQRAD